MSKIVRSGSYLPINVLSNEALIKRYHLDSNDEWIIQRTGIKQRYIAQKESVVDLAIESAKVIINQFDEDIASKINLIITASMSSKLPTPSIANQVQQAIGATNAWGFDINGACSAFIMALDIADKYAIQYQTGYTLVIGTEKMSDLMDYHDRSTCILFGDGAAAILIENDGQSLLNYRSQLFVKDDINKAIVVNRHTNHKMTMNGKEVLSFVSRQVVPSLKAFLKDEDSQPDYIICHQANIRIIEMISKKLAVEPERVPINIQKVANVSAASIPLVIDEMIQAKRIRLEQKQTSALCGFGAGLAWGFSSLTI